MTPKPDDLTFILAIWGATLSTALGILQAIKFAQGIIQNKRRLRVSFHPEISASPNGEPRMYIRIYVVNIGQRPVQLISAGLVLQNGIQYDQAKNYDEKDNLPRVCMQIRVMSL